MNKLNNLSMFIRRNAITISYTGWTVVMENSMNVRAIGLFYGVYPVATNGTMVRDGHLGLTLTN